MRMSGLGISIQGMQTTATSKNSNWIWSWLPPISPHIGCPPQQSWVFPSFRGKLIIVVMTDGALAAYRPQLTVHLYTIKKSMYPKRRVRKISWGTNSKKKSIMLQKYKLLDALMKTPRVMCTTAMITDIFIFKEFMKTRLFSATAQTGSIPIGYIHYPYLGMGPP